MTSGNDDGSEEIPIGKRLVRVRSNRGENWLLASCRVTTVSENVKDLLGNLPAEPCSDPHWWLERIHPEDRDAVQRTLDFRRWPDDTLLRRYRLRHADGHYVFVKGA